MLQARVDGPETVGEFGLHGLDLAREPVLSDGAEGAMVAEGGA